MGIWISGRFLAFFTAVLLAVGSPLRGHSLSLPSVVHPAVYQSPDGAYSLQVDPADRYGYGAAAYTFTEVGTGKTLWQKDLTFALRDAVVTDAGQVYGYGFSGQEGIGGREPKEFWIVLLDERGEVSMKEVRRMQPRSQFFPSAHTPDSNPIVFDQGARALLPLDHEPWRIYDLVDGTMQGIFKPDYPGEVKGRMIYDLVWIPNTDLILTRWIGDWKDGARFVIFRSNGEAVWSTETSTGRSPDDPPDEVSPYLHFPIISAKPVDAGDDDPFVDKVETVKAHFELGFGDKGESRTFAVTLVLADDGGGGSPFETEVPAVRTPEAWKISEISMREWSPKDEDELPPVPDGFAPIGLEQLGEFTLKVGGRPDTLRKITVGASGRIYALEESGTVRVFDPVGEYLHLCEPPAETVSEPFFYGITIFEGHTGELYLGPKCELDSTEENRAGLVGKFFQFDASGGVTDLELELSQSSIQNVVPAGDSGNLWVGGLDEFSLVKPGGEVVTSIDRRVDRDWMYFPIVVVSPGDGSLAVSSGRSGYHQMETNAAPSPNPEFVVSIYAKDGSPLRTIDSDAFPYPSIAYDGRTLVLTRKDGVFFIAAEGKPIGWLKAEIDDDQVFLGGGGKELLIASPKTGRVVRYAMPK